LTILIEKLTLPKLTVPPDVLARCIKKYPDFPYMSDEEYKNLLHLTEITVDEYNVIHAMQTQIGLEILEAKLTAENYYRLEDLHKWIIPYKLNKFKGYDEAKKHLEDVEKWHMEHHGQHYSLWFIDSVNHVKLLDWSEALVDRGLAKYGEAKRQKKSVWSYGE